MSRRRKLKQHLRRLEEIRNIMEAMKNLSVLETHKLAAILANQKLSLQELENIASDFLTFYPHALTPGDDYTDIWLLFGSERGFCGDFNDSLIAYLNGKLSPAGNKDLHVIPVGSKLCARMQDDPRVFAYVEGADIAEETVSVLNTVIRHIGIFQSQHENINVFALYHHDDSNELASLQLLPPFRGLPPDQNRHAYAPRLNLPAEDFYLDMLDRYLFVALQDITSTSLMAENYRRIQHMSGAIRRLEESESHLLRTYHQRRQEEITEEIEVILLNAADTG
jgi:F-type H+-transporting ATPase subunit gamma